MHPFVATDDGDGDGDGEGVTEEVFDTEELRLEPGVRDGSGDGDGDGGRGETVRYAFVEVDKNASSLMYT